MMKLKKWQKKETQSELTNTIHLTKTYLSSKITKRSQPDDRGGMDRKVASEESPSSIGQGAG